MEYYDLFGRYLLIIAYVTGNVLAYNSVDNPDYKMPMVYGFNAIVALVYAYTYWERLGGKQLAEKTYQDQIDKLREEFKVNQEEWDEIHAKATPPPPQTWTEQITHPISQSPYNIYSEASTQTKFNELAGLQNFIQRREIEEQKAAQMAQQAETIQKAAELEAQIKDNLSQAQKSLGEPRITWRLIHEKYPQFERQSVLLAEFEKANKLLDQPSTTTNLTIRLERLPLPDWRWTNFTL